MRDVRSHKQHVRTFIGVFRYPVIAGMGRERVDIVPLAAIHGVIARPALHEIIADTTVKQVISHMSVHGIIAIQAVQYRASDFGAHQIIELRTHIGFNAGVGVARRVAGILGDILQIEGDARSSGLICHGVESITAVQQVRAGVAAQHIVAGTAIEGVVSFSANQGIVADTTIKEVVTTFAE